MALDNQVRSLIAVGAAVSTNCQSCLERTIDLARKQGATDRQIADAIDIGTRVRHGAATKIEDFAARLHGATAPRQTGAGRGCECK